MSLSKTFDNVCNRVAVQEMKTMKLRTPHAVLITRMSVPTNQWTPVNLTVDWTQFTITWAVSNVQIAGLVNLKHTACTTNNNNNNLYFTSNLK